MKPTFLEFLEGNKQAIVVHISRGDILAAVAWEKNPWKKVQNALRIMKSKEDFLDKTIREQREHEERSARGEAVDARGLHMAHYEFLSELLAVHAMLKRLSWFQKLFLPTPVRVIAEHFESEKYWVKELADFGYFHRYRILASGDYRP
jgi:hypothetical protein